MIEKIEDKMTASPPPAQARPSLVTSALSWRPRYLQASAGLVHAPLAFWLVETCRPLQIVELGAGAAVYFAFCQAVDRLGLETACLGVVPAGGEASERARRYNDTQYREFSRRILAETADGSDAPLQAPIDLLHVDLAVTPELLESLDRVWLPRLSERGVLLLSGTAAGFGAAPAADWLRALRAAHPSWETDPGAGLVVAAMGPRQPEALLRLIAAAAQDPAEDPAEDPGAAELVAAFEDRGAAAARLIEETGALEIEAEVETQIARLRADRFRIRDRMLAHKAALRVRAKQTLDVQDRLMARELELEAQAALLAEADARRAETEAALGPLSAELEAAQTARDARDLQNRELRDYGKQLERKYLAALNGGNDLRNYAKQLERKHLAVLRSSSWRITAPLRFVVDRALGRRGAGAFAPQLVSGKDAKDAPGADLPGRSGGGYVSRLAEASQRAKASTLSKVSTLTKSVQSGVAIVGGGEMIPFQVLKAARPPVAQAGPPFVFAITLASARTVEDWGHTQQLLEATLRSVIGQTDPNWTAIIAGHEMPDVAGLQDPRVEFVAIDRARPSQKSQFRADKSAKRHVLGRRLAQMGGGYFMQLDADDLVRDDLVETLRREGYPNGAVSRRGYALDYLNRRLAPVPGAWRHDLSNVCGSCSVVRYMPEDLPTNAHRNNDSGLIFNMTRQHAYTTVAMEELGRPLEDFAAPMVVYLVNHAQNLSFSLQKAGGRGAYIVEAVAQHALDPEEARTVLARFGLADWS